jgi:cell division protein FtsZ
MSEGGAALMAVGRSTGDDRARQAAEAAISSSLLDVTIDGARGILFNITGGTDMTLFEINEAAAIIKESAHPEVNLIFGAQIDETMGDEIRITVIATGFEQSRAAKNIMARQPVQQPRPVQQQRPMHQPVNPPQEQPRPQPQAPQQPAQQPFAPPPQPVQQPVVYDENDIEIPTFLRKRR